MEALAPRPLNVCRQLLGPLVDWEVPGRFIEGGRSSSHGAIVFLPSFFLSLLTLRVLD